MYLHPTSNCLAVSNADQLAKILINDIDDKLYQRQFLKTAKDPTVESLKSSMVKYYIYYHIIIMV